MRAILTAIILASMALPAAAALPQGARAPGFVTTAAVGGKAFRLELEAAAAQGPVVLYFFPKAFTKGCTLEAHAFSEAVPEFRKAGARVIGMSRRQHRHAQEILRRGVPQRVSGGRASPELIREL